MIISEWTLHKRLYHFVTSEGDNYIAQLNYKVISYS